MLTPYGTSADISAALFQIVATKGDSLDQENKLKCSGLTPYFDHIEVMSDKTDKEYIMMLTCWLQDNCPVMVGLMEACPDGKGFTATFEEFKVTPLADQRRLEWAKRQMNK